MPRLQIRPAEVPGPVVGAVVLVLYLGSAAYSLWLNDPVNAGAGFWPAAGIVLAALLLVPVRRWGWVVGAVLLAEIGGDLAHGYPLGASLWWGAGNAVGPLVAAVGLRRAGTDGRLAPIRSLALFVLWGVVIGSLVAATVGSIGTVTTYGRVWMDVWPRWWVGDGLGVLVVAPVFLAWREPAHGRRAPAETAALVGAVVLVTALVFRDWDVSWDAVLPHLTIPVLLWAALRYGVRATALAGFVIAQGANVASALGSGEGALALAAGDDAVALLQLFLVITLLTALVVAALAHDLARGLDLQHELAHQAGHDVLTGLPNRSLVSERLGTLLALPDSDHRLCVLFMDLDRFKVINDSLGHHAGDAVLVEVAQRLASTCRPGDTVARLGGDEFVVICPGLGCGDGADELARRVLDAVAVPVAFDGKLLSVGASIGVVVAEGGETPESLLRDGDTAMYEAKGRGRNRFERFEPDHRQRALERWVLESELRGAVGRGELLVHYQPMVAVETGRVLGVEALVRWQHPTRGLLGPDAFLAVAEETGIIHEIGDWVLETSVAQLARWRPDLVLSVNASPLQFDRPAGDARDLLAVIADACAASGIEPDRLWLELTESALLPDALTAPLDALHHLGVHLVVDDFGTGYSSLARLRSLPFGVLKIDGSFVADLSCEGADGSLLASVIDLAHALGMVAVAERVETEEQYRAIRRMGCDVAQGYHLGRPAPASDLDDLVAAPVDSTGPVGWRTRRRVPSGFSPADRPPAAGGGRSGRGCPGWRAGRPRRSPGRCRRPSRSGRWSTSRSTR